MSVFCVLCVCRCVAMYVIYSSKALGSSYSVAQTTKLSFYDCIYSTVLPRGLDPTLKLVADFFTTPLQRTVFSNMHNRVPGSPTQTLTTSHRS